MGLLGTTIAFVDTIEGSFDLTSRRKRKKENCVIEHLKY